MIGGYDAPNTQNKKQQPGCCTNFMTCSAKFLVLSFSFVTLLLGTLALAVGGASLAKTFVGDLISDHITYAVIATGAVLVLVALLGCTGACYAKSRRCSLMTMTFFTFLVCVASAVGFALVFEYQDIVKVAAKANFTMPDGQAELGAAEQKVYGGIRSGFSNAFDRCEAAVYNTTDLTELRCAGHAECEVDGEAALPAGRTYMYCKGDAPTTLVYPAAGEVVKHPEEAIVAEGLGWWVSEYCLPPPATFAAAMDEAADVGAGAAPSPFGACYASAWWEAEPLAHGAPIYEWMPAGEAFNAKAAFCFCSVSAEGSDLWARIVHYSSLVKWVSLGLCVFFFLCFLAEVYLVCCRKEQMDGEYDSNTRGKDRMIDMRRP